VLKKISLFVKNLIFYNEGISRSAILEKSFTMDGMDLRFPTMNNKTARSNLKRRVYDSISVLVASRIVGKKTVRKNGRREYYYKPLLKVTQEDSDKREVLLGKMRGVIGGIQKKLDLLDKCRVWYEEWKSLIDSNKRKGATAIEDAGSSGEFSVDFRDIAVISAGLDPNNLKNAGLDPDNLKKSGFHVTA
jgi:hypothetical protein